MVKRIRICKRCRTDADSWDISPSVVRFCERHEIGPKEYLDSIGICPKCWQEIMLSHRARHIEYWTLEHFFGDT